VDIIPLIAIPEKKFRISAETIFYKKDTFPLNSLRHIQYQKTRTIHKTNFVKTGESLEAMLIITLDSGKELTISFYKYGEGESAEIAKVDDTLINLLNLTRNNRVKKYFEDVEKLGYFRYGTLKFYPKEKIVRGKKEYRIVEYKVLKSGRLILLRNKNDKGLFRKMSNYFTNVSFEMKYDPDIAFFMLDKFFGWKWNES
jgi:hypothetical protein